MFKTFRVWETVIETMKRSIADQSDGESYASMGGKEEWTFVEISLEEWTFRELVWEKWTF